MIASCFQSPSPKISQRKKSPGKKKKQTKCEMNWPKANDPVIIKMADTEVSKSKSAGI